MHSTNFGNVHFVFSHISNAFCHNGYHRIKEIKLKLVFDVFVHTLPANIKRIKKLK